MSAAPRRAALACAAAIAATSIAARADDPPTAGAATDDKPKVEGDVRAGWRFLSGEGEGRFQQDIGLKDGPRVFDFNALATNLGGRTPFDEAQAHFDGIGDRNSDYLMSVRKRDVLDVSGGYRRDDSVYSAAGDIFPYGTLRERGFVHARWTPDRSLTVHLTWDRGSQTSDSDGASYSDILQVPKPPQTFADKQQSLPQTGRVTQITDDFALGADWAPGIFRFGLTQSVRLGRGENDTTIQTTQAGEQLHDDVDQSSRLKTYVTTGKAGVVVLDGKLDATLFVTSIESPLKARANGDSRSFDSNDAIQTGSFHTDSELRRSELDWRLESSWRPHRDWEVTAAAERGNQVSDESVDRQGSDYPSPAPNSTTEYRITDRTQRWSGDVTWEAVEGLRLRVGEQYLYEDLYDSTSTHFNEQNVTDFSSASWRTTVGADWTNPDKVWSVGALAHHSTNDAPQTTPVPDSANDWTLRGRWRSPSKELTMTALWRHVAATHSGAVDLTSLGTTPGSTNLGSATRSDSVSGSATWTHEKWTVRGTGTYRTFDTSSDTAYAQWVTVGGVSFPNGRKVFETVGFSGRDVVANLDVRYEFTKTLRAVTDLTGTDASGDYTARWLQMSVGGEYDLRKDLTLGVTLSSWRLNEENSGGDNYRTYGAEVSLTYRF